MLDDGERLDYFYDVVSLLQQDRPKNDDQEQQIGKMAANW